MAAKNLSSADSTAQFNNMGGETRNHVPEYAAIGAGLGLVAGLILGYLAVSRELVVPGFDIHPGWLVFSFYLFSSIFCLAAAGAVVGIGVPKFNPHPNQGPIKRWRSVVVTKGKHREVFFVPEEKRAPNKPVHAMNWKRREPLPPTKGYGAHPPHQHP